MTMEDPAAEGYREFKGEGRLGEDINGAVATAQGSDTSGLFAAVGASRDGDWGLEEADTNEYGAWLDLMWTGIVTRLSTLWDYLSEAFLPHEMQQEYFRHGQALALFQLRSKCYNRLSIKNSMEAELKERRASAVDLRRQLEESEDELAGLAEERRTVDAELKDAQAILKKRTPRRAREADEERKVKARATVRRADRRIKELERKGETLPRVIAMREQAVDETDKMVHDLERGIIEIEGRISAAKIAGRFYDTKPLLEELAKPKPSASAVESLAPSVWQRLFAYAKLTSQGTAQLHREAMLARTLHTNPDVGVGNALERRRRRQREDD